MGYMASANANKIADMEQVEQDHPDDFIEPLQLTDTEKAELEAISESRRGNASPPSQESPS